MKFDKLVEQELNENVFKKVKTFVKSRFKSKRSIQSMLEDLDVIIETHSAMLKLLMDMEDNTSTKFSKNLLREGNNLLKNFKMVAEDMEKLIDTALESEGIDPQEFANEWNRSRGRR